MPSGRPLSIIVDELRDFGARLEGDANVLVTDARQDSRRVEIGDLFIARSGGTFDGARFVADAVRRGASAILAAEAARLPAVDVPVVRVVDPARVASAACEAVHGHPSRGLSVVGITGTNGKTTTAYLVEQAINAARGHAARLGTLGYTFAGDVVGETLTTPGADDISRFLARARDAGATHFVMEVSSHALAQWRVDGVRFAVAAFTNLTQDHLDYHQTMEEYGAAKERLFTALIPQHCVVNVDDPYGALLAGRAVGHVVRVGSTPQSDVHPLKVEMDAGGLRGSLRIGSKTVPVETLLVGRHNLENLLVALATVDALGLDVVETGRGLSGTVGAPGRLERCDGESDDIVVLVDYAHTPDALERVLEAVRPLTSGKVTCVFGCGGDRDAAKRPRMGAAVGRAADRAIVTNDNPRSEDPEAIAKAILEGLSVHAIPYEVILDRKHAIERAIESAQPGDVVVIAGKGHEPYQIIGTERRGFDDRAEARSALRARRSRS